MLICIKLSLDCTISGKVSLRNILFVWYEYPLFLLGFLVQFNNALEMLDTLNKYNKSRHDENLRKKIKADLYNQHAGHCTMHRLTGICRIFLLVFSLLQIDNVVTWMCMLFMYIHWPVPLFTSVYTWMGLKEIKKTS